MDNFEELDPTQPHLSFSEQIDQICDDFEAAWQKGNRIRIETCLKLVNEGARSELLRELLEIELETRKMAGESLQMESYLSRFPDEKTLVKQVFQDVVTPRRLGDYELLELLGHGGMGVVYRAKQTYLHQTVALKILPEQYMSDQHAVSRFRREMQLIGGLKHPNIVQAYNAGEADGVNYLVMEYVAGITLQRLIADRMSNKLGGLSIGAACEVVRQAALGLQHAHQRGLVHRDIKPGNLMLDRNGMVKVLDLGLGKFQADVRKGDQTAGPLTQVGTTMGTVDYMAPEQWDDPTTVGIQADLYSLGCTLFFLLCGSPPFGGKNYETNRAKLMAHIVNEPPSLKKANPDVPRVLQDVYLAVMAKDPKDRFSQPIELVEAIEPFASIDELVEYIPEELITTDSGGTGSSSSMHRSDVETVVGRRLTSNKRKIRIPQRKKPWYKQQKFYVVLGILSISLVILGIWYFTKNTMLVGTDDPSIISPTIGTTSRQESESYKIMTDLVELPGLSGQWWFAEMPWYLPFVREAVGKTLLETKDISTILGPKKDGYLDSDTVLMQEWLRNVANHDVNRLTASQLKLYNDLINLADTNLADEEYHEKLEAAYKHFAESSEKKSPADIHTEAVLLQSLSAWKTDLKYAEEAKGKFEDAIAGYAKIAKTDATAPQLKLFAQSDLARLFAGTFNDFDRSVEIFQQIYADATPLFRVDIFVTWAANAASKGKYDDKFFEGAENNLRNVIGLRGGHPLFAHIYERYAWSLIDQWQIGKAKKYFDEALEIRNSNAREGQNPFADIYVFHNMHGLAMVARYSGDLDTARKNYDEVIAKIAAKYEKPTISPDTPGQLRYYRELRERLSNSRERRADCELLSGAASGSRNVNLRLAETRFDESQKLADVRAARILITCRLCIVQALLGNIDEAKLTLDGLRAEAKMITNKQSLFTTQRTLDLTGFIIDACSPDQETVDRGLDDLRKFFAEYSRTASTSPDADQNRRETMEFRLFCVEFLLYRDMNREHPDREVINKDIQYLLSLLSFFRSKPETYPFIRRYNDLVIQAMGTNDLDQLANQIVHYRAVGKVDQGNETGSATTVYFYFAPDQNHAMQNFALFFPSNTDKEKTSRLFSISSPFTRDGIKQAANTNKTLELPEDDPLFELFKWIDNDRRSGRIVNIIWSDRSCWPDDRQALLDTDWPFNNICPLKVSAEILEEN